MKECWLIVTILKFGVKKVVNKGVKFPLWRENKPEMSASLSLHRCIARIFQRREGAGSQVVSMWGYSPDCHLDLRAMFQLNVTCLGWAVRVVGKTSYKIASRLVQFSLLIFQNIGVDDEWQRFWWSHQYFVTYEYYVNCGHTNEMKMWSSQLWLGFKQLHFSKPEKMFSGLQQRSNPWPLR